MGTFPRGIYNNFRFIMATQKRSGLLNDALGFPTNALNTVLYRIYILAFLFSLLPLTYFPNPSSNFKSSLPATPSPPLPLYLRQTTTPPIFSFFFL